MEAGVAVVAVNHFVALVVGAAEADLAVRLELLVASLRLQGSFKGVIFLTGDVVVLEDPTCFVAVALDEEFKDGGPVEGLEDAVDLFLLNAKLFVRHREVAREE